MPSAPPQSSDLAACAKLSFRISGSVKEVESQDGAVLLDIEQGVCFSLTPVASRIWHLLKQNCDIKEITKVICAEFTAPRDLVESDLAEFLNALRRHKLLFDGSGSPKQRRLGGWLWRALSRLRA